MGEIMFITVPKELIEHTFYFYIFKSQFIQEEILIDSWKGRTHEEGRLKFKQCLPEELIIIRVGYLSILSCTGPALKSDNFRRDLRV